MITALRDRSRQRNLTAALVAAAVLALAFYLGQRASIQWLGLIAAVITLILLLRRPSLGLHALIVVAFLLPISLGTGTEVRLGSATLFIPILVLLWLLGVWRQRGFPPARSRVWRPLLGFVLAGLLSLAVGIIQWDPLVPRSDRFLLVQLAQWALFAFSALVFWLGAQWPASEFALRRLTLFFLGLGGLIMALTYLPAGMPLKRLISITPGYPPLLAVFGALAAGQLFYDRSLSRPWRFVMAAIVAATLFQGLVLQRDNVSTLIGLGVAAGVFIWLRWPRLRWLLLVLVTMSALLGVLFPTLYDFAGGDEEWEASGGSRLVLIGRVIEVTMRNPITGLGPAAYRPYTALKPLPYGRAYWVVPQVSSHNNYVDLFSHTGLLGLGLFLWFAGEVIWLGLRLRRRWRTGFAAGYVNGMVAGWLGCLAAMALGDWVLPFVYNLGFPAFQGTALVWMLLGGLVALEQISQE